MAATSTSEADQDSEPVEPPTLPSPPSFKFDEKNSSSQNLLIRDGSGYESQYGSMFGSRFSLTDGSGVFISSLALTVIVSATAIVGIVLVTAIITLAVLLSSCENRSMLNLGNSHFADPCHSFRLNVELDNVKQGWVVPSLCEHYIFNYVHGGQYMKDMEDSVDSARRYLKTLRVKHDLNYAVVLDIDETALSNAFNYKKLSYSSEGFMEFRWSLWMNKTKASPVVPILNLYRELHAANWSIFFLSERPESLLDFTANNMIECGYESWTSLILRSPEDANITVQAYKMIKRNEIEKQGYQIVSVLGDQWSDLAGYASGTRTFKLPNPMYHIA